MADRSVTFSDAEFNELEEDFEFGVLARVCKDSKYPGKDGFVKVLKKLWAPEGNTIFTEIGADAMVVNFTSKEQQEKVLTNGPWRCEHWIILVSE